MNTPTKGTVLNVVSLIVACLALALSFGNSIRTYYRNQAVTTKLNALIEEHKMLMKYTQETVIPTVKSLPPYIESNQKIEAARSRREAIDAGLMSDFSNGLDKQRMLAEVVTSNAKLTQEQITIINRRLSALERVK